ncbi:MAG: hypothetical protein IJI33_00495 [Solobacterium sp.]|nr:hypothetical protein [Solobacterium sp.]
MKRSGASRRRRCGITAAGENMVFCVFNEAGIRDQVKTGDSVTMEGNYLVYNDEFGIVLKNCRLCREDRNG